jgi:hypothetical protein
MKKAQESEAALRSLLASSEVGEVLFPQGDGHIGSLKIREVEGGVMDAPGTALLSWCEPTHPGLCIASCTPYLKGWSAQRALTRIPCSSNGFERGGRVIGSSE